jgi:hypothetical protein
VRLTDCGVVVRLPFVPKVSELGNTVIVKTAGVADCAIITVWPAIVNDPFLLCVPAFAVTDQFTVLPEAAAVAHGTLELTGTTGQVVTLGVTNIVPEEAALPSVRLVAFNKYEQAPEGE